MGCWVEGQQTPGNHEIDECAQNSLARQGSEAWRIGHLSLTSAIFRRLPPRPPPFYLFITTLALLQCRCFPCDFIIFLTSFFLLFCVLFFCFFFNFEKYFCVNKATKVRSVKKISKKNLGGTGRCRATRVLSFRLLSKFVSCHSHSSSPLCRAPLCLQVGTMKASTSPI